MPWEGARCTLAAATPAIRHPQGMQPGQLSAWERFLRLSLWDRLERLDASVARRLPARPGWLPTRPVVEQQFGGPPSVLRHVRAVAALLGLPLGAFIAAMAVARFLYPGTDVQTCGWCDGLVGGASLIGLLWGMSLAGRIWVAGMSPNEAIRRVNALALAWFWIAICSAVIVWVLVQTSWGFVVLGAVLAVPAVAGIRWATAKRWDE
jgi:hypothetical protein